MKLFLCVLFSGHLMATAMADLKIVDPCPEDGNKVS